MNQKSIVSKSTLIVVLLIVSLFSSIVLSDNSPYLTLTMVSQTPAQVEPGQTFKVRFKIENEGSQTEDEIIISLNEKYPFSMYGDESEKNIGKIKSSAQGSDAEYVEFQLKVDENAVEGEEELELSMQTSEGVKINYDDNEFIIDIQTHDAILEISSVEIEPQNINPGSNSKISFIIKNNADSLLKNIKIKLDLESEDLPFAPFQMSSEKNLAQLQSEFSKTLEFEIISDSSSDEGLYKIPVEINYYDEIGNEYNSTDIVAIMINKKPSINAYIKKSNINQAGKDGKVTIAIANKGIGDINFLELEIIETNSYQLLSPSNYFYIGNLDSDDTESEEIEIYVPVINKELSIPIKLYYGDNNNVEYQQEFDLALKLYSKEEMLKYGLDKKEDNAINYLIGIIIIIGLVFYFYRRRKTKNNKKK